MARFCRRSTNHLVTRRLYCKSYEQQIPRRVVLNGLLSLAVNVQGGLSRQFRSIAETGIHIVLLNITYAGGRTDVRD